MMTSTKVDVNVANISAVEVGIVGTISFKA